MSVLINRCVRRSFLVEELVESWQVHHRTATYAPDAEALVGECLDLSTLLTDSWRKLNDLLFDGQIFDIAAAGNLLAGCVTRTIPLLKRVHGFVRHVKKSDHDIARVSELESAIREMTNLQNAIEKEWPRIDLNVVEESLADYQRGEFKDAEALLNGLQSHSS